MSTTIEEADVLFAKIPSNEEMESFVTKHEATDDPELLWRLARFSRILCTTHTDAAKGKAYSIKISEFAQEGLKLNAESAGCNKFAAIGIMKGPTSQTEKAKRVNDVKAYFKRASELDPQDPHALLMLGTWHYRIADMPWLLKKIVNAVHSDPPQATYKEALGLFEQAEKVRPGFSLRNFTMLGKTHLRLGDKVKAKEFLQKAVKFMPKRPEEDEFNTEAKNLSKGL